MEILFPIFQFFRCIFEYVMDTVWAIYYFRKRIIIDPPTNPLVLESATALARKIRENKVTSLEVVKAFIDRINETNPTLNALVDERFPEALKEARKVDERIKKGEISDAEFSEKPFLGVPFTSKESIHCKGLSVTFGLIKRIDYKAKFDADIVTALKNAGGILLGVTNIPQINLWQETMNPVYGQTKNPYDTTKSAGGSCGGECSALAACATPLGLGSELGGSSRIPAFMCGVFGHKLSVDLASVKGITYRDGTEEDTMVSPGALTKYAEDLYPLLKVIAGNNAEKLNLDEPVIVSNLKVYYITNPRDKFCSAITKEIESEFLRVVQLFSEISSEEPKELYFDELGYVTKLWNYMMSLEPNMNFKNDINNREGEIGSIKEIIKHFTIGGDYTIATILNIVNGMLPKFYQNWSKQSIEQLRIILSATLGNNGVLLYPSGPLPARRHYTAIFRPYNFSFFSIWNVLKFPVTQVPIGIGEEGVPLGIQVVAGPYQDRLCLAVAKELEEQFGGWVPPFEVKEEAKEK